jgi:hypothetical protein
MSLDQQIDRKSEIFSNYKKKLLEPGVQFVQFVQCVQQLIFTTCVRKPPDLEQSEDSYKSHKSLIFC